MASDLLLTQNITPYTIVDNINEIRYMYPPKDYYLKLALMYAQYGSYVLPVKSDKFPYKGFKWTERATKNPDEIKELWKIYKDGRPAIYCKQSGYVIIDVDNKPEKGKLGFKVLNELIVKLGKLPKTVLVYTQSNGLHLYFKLPPNRKFAWQIENCIDIRTNAYCLCGGVFANGNSYRFAKGHTFEDIGEIPDLPETWIQYLSQEEKIYKNSNKKYFSNKQKLKPKIVGDFEVLYNECSFCQHCVDFGHLLCEPYWFKFASVLSTLENGFELFDKFSQPYPKYTFEKTKAKYDNAKKFDFLCKTLAKDFSGCNDCKYNYYKGENND